ncbi:unnamed protein product [Leptidea sinapis]|uniref:Uncharacterized protein n=1 Tax=Leptidea sinapis TaxID=189913 RepID=A0A5E4QQA2_9NEOP|nr:unnamed protein product [Leptidea sinapis]
MQKHKSIIKVLALVCLCWMDGARHVHVCVTTPGTRLCVSGAVVGDEVAASTCTHLTVFVQPMYLNVYTTARDNENDMVVHLIDYNCLRWKINGEEIAYLLR